jgi:hypothetical protein
MELVFHLYEDVEGKVRIRASKSLDLVQQAMIPPGSIQPVVACYLQVSLVSSRDDIPALYT